MTNSPFIVRKTETTAYNSVTSRKLLETFCHYLRVYCNVSENDWYTVERILRAVIIFFRPDSTVIAVSAYITAKVGASVVKRW